MTKQEYINTYWQAAQDACAGTKLFPILALAESAVESAWGGSYLTLQALNFFGIKSTPEWESKGGKFVIKPTHEVIHGQLVTVSAKFRKYDTPKDCFADWVSFVSGPRYIAAGVLQAITPETQIQCIAQAGYATDPAYAKTVTSVIEGLKPLLNL